MVAAADVLAPELLPTNFGRFVSQIYGFPEDMTAVQMRHPISIWLSSAFGERSHSGCSARSVFEN